MKTIAFIPADDNNWGKHGENLVKSLRKFHSEEELPVIRYDNPNPHDIDFWYKAKPIIANDLFSQGYERVIGMDADMIVTGRLDDILKDVDKFDAGVVLNDPAYPIRVWDITHPTYYNNALVVLQSYEFAKHWLRLCNSSHFLQYQYREQDLLTLLCSDYFNYKVKVLDNPLKVYGEVIKPQWMQIAVEDNKLMLGKTQVCIISFGGGNTPDKGNYRIRFKENVVNFIDKLLK